jgi:hypothetical protein
MAWDEELKYRRQVADEQKYAAEITRRAMNGTGTCRRQEFWSHIYTAGGADRNAI